MRTIKYFSLMLSVATLTAVAGCTVKDVDTPALAGPSTFANNIVMTANTNTLVQDGVSQALITIKATDAAGNLKNIPLRADITVDGTGPGLRPPQHEDADREHYAADLHGTGLLSAGSRAGRPDRHHRGDADGLPVISVRRFRANWTFAWCRRASFSRPTRT